MEQEYNDWTNYETWLIQAHYHDQIENIINKTKHKNLQNIEIEIIGDITKRIKDVYIPNRFVKDAVNIALEKVNWAEVTENYYRNRARKIITKTVYASKSIAIGGQK